MLPCSLFRPRCAGKARVTIGTTLSSRSALLETEDLSGPYTVSSLPPDAAKPLVVEFHTSAMALGQACAALRTGHRGVPIQDRRGSRIEGAKLEACCRGEKSVIRALSETAH